MTPTPHSPLTPNQKGTNPHAAQPTSLVALGKSLWRNRQLIVQMTKREVVRLVVNRGHENITQPFAVDKTGARRQPGRDSQVFSAFFGGYKKSRCTPFLTYLTMKPLEIASEIGNTYLLLVAPGMQV